MAVVGCAWCRDEGLRRHELEERAPARRRGLPPQCWQHPVAERGFALDMNALRWCDACVLVLPCGRSAHLEAGWAAGAGKVLVIYIPEYDTPELMYGMASAIVTTLAEIREKVMTL
ncbi:hypothetical protein A2Z56_04540 [Candidatus Kaiserbacteria bacterium RIFCSPHIGHO2_12_45_16]|nr:MAG: hypothetical protein A2Z56_04540 [Candidatus Kaiserbacteria bacterium RIFCSPHIGHO2_12_45_16]